MRLPPGSNTHKDGLDAVRGACCAGNPPGQNRQNAKTSDDTDGLGRELTLARGGVEGPGGADGRVPAWFPTVSFVVPAWSRGVHRWSRLAPVPVWLSG
jgi:hypothetical protein